MLTAAEIFRIQLEGWGEKDAYLVTEAEFLVLSDEAEIIETLKKDNGDGTFFSSLIFRGHRFVSVS